MKDSFLCNLGRFVLRIGFAAAMLYGHGWQKLMHAFSGAEITFFDPIGLGPVASFYLVALAESICSAFIILGIYTRLFSIPLAIAMGVAFFVHHANDPFLPFKPKEVSGLFFTAFFSIFLLGGGKYALQTLFNRKSPPSNAFTRFLSE